MPDTKIDIAGAIERAKLASPLACPTSLGWKAWVKDLQILGNQLEQSQREVGELKSELKGAEEEIDQLQVEVDQWEADQKADHESFEARVAELTAEVEQLTGDLNTMAAHANALSDKRVAAEALVARLREALEGAQLNESSLAEGGQIREADARIRWRGPDALDRVRKLIDELRPLSRQALQEGE